MADNNAIVLAKILYLTNPWLVNRIFVYAYQTDKNVSGNPVYDCNNMNTEIVLKMERRLIQFACFFINKGSVA